MALTYALTLTNNWVMGSERLMLWSCVATGTYATGNTADLTPANLGLDVIDYMDVGIDGNGANTNGVVIVGYDATHTKLRMYWSKTAGQTFAEVDNGTTLTGLTLNLLCFGVD